MKRIKSELSIKVYVPNAKEYKKIPEEKRRIIKSKVFDIRNKMEALQNEISSAIDENLSEELGTGTETNFTGFLLKC